MSGVEAAPTTAIETATARAISTAAPPTTAADPADGRSNIEVGPGQSPVNSGTEGKEKWAAAIPASAPATGPGRETMPSSPAIAATRVAWQAYCCESDGFHGTLARVGGDGKEHRASGQERAFGAYDEEELESERRSVLVESELDRTSCADFQTTLIP